MNEKVYQIVERKRNIHFFSPGELVVIVSHREIKDGIEYLGVQSVGGEKVGLWQTIEHEDIVELKEEK